MLCYAMIVDPIWEEQVRLPTAYDLCRYNS
jgi:hypothetical protein